MKKKSVRLPNHIKPLRYKLLIKPNLENFTFEGEETISLVIDKPTFSITLHSKELNIFDAEYQVSGIKYKAKKTLYDKKSETATFNFNHKIPKGKGSLVLKFKGILNGNMRGFYRSRYMHEGKEKHLATTQFEATDARRAFPCFDEPSQKAIFDVTVMVPNGLTAISNTVETSIKEHESGYKLVEFGPTPKMSTYLLAFIVGDFEFIEGKTKRGVVVRVFVTPGKKHQAKFALNTAIKTLDFYEKYFAINYPLPILDLIAIPDFSHGAMENWGAITYRESALLVDEENSSASNKQWVALVIAHELAHQWFGNLVTMHWWTDLWLNEGFASYIEYLAVDYIFPKWDIWTQFAHNDLNVALKLDSLNSTHPVEIEVKHPDEIGEIFDEVSYSKGASIIRMLANYLGENKFRDGLRYYLKKHAYENTFTSDLWKAFEKVSKKPVYKLMQNWTKKPGFPVLKVIDKPTKYQIIQQRYFSSAISKKQSKDKTTWNIPLKIQDNNSKIHTIELKSKINFIPKYKSSWIKFNFNEASFLRVDYPAQILQQLQEPILKKVLSPLDRLGIVRDALALSESGDSSTVEALRLIKSYVNEDNYTVWVEIISGLYQIDNLLFEKTPEISFRNFAVKVLEKIVKNTGFNEKKAESHLQGLLRSLVLQASGNFGDLDILGKSKEVFLKWKNSNIPVKPNLRNLVYTISATTGNESDFKFLKKQYSNESLHEEKNRIGRAITCFTKSNLIKMAIDFAMSDEVRLQDKPSMFMSFWQNYYARDLVWEFTKKHWKKLENLYPSSSHMISRFIKPASLMNTQNFLNDFKKFFSKNKFHGANRAVKQTIEKIESNILWKEKDKQKIINWLNEK